MTVVLAASPRRLARLAVILMLSTSLVGCTTTGTGQKETTGTAVGAVLGGIAGAALGGRGSGRVIGALAGIAIGSLVGNRIGAMLDEEDQRELQEKAKQALVSQPDNTQVAWNSQRSGATATVVPENTRTETREVKVVREANVAPATQMDLIGAKYIAKGAAPVRLAPTANAEIATTLQNGAGIWAVGRVQGQPWIMVAKNGKSIGYVQAASLAPAPKPTAVAAAQPVTKTTATKVKTETAPAPSVQQATAAFDLDAAAPVRTPADLDALAPTEKADVVVASVTCRDLRTTASAKGQTETATQTACKSPDGSWQLN